MKTIPRMLVAVCAVLFALSAPLVSASGSSGSEGTLSELKSRARMLEMHVKVLKSMSRMGRSYKKKYKRAVSQLASVNQQIAILQAGSGPQPGESPAPVSLLPGATGGEFGPQPGESPAPVSLLPGATGGESGPQPGESPAPVSLLPGATGGESGPMPEIDIKVPFGSIYPEEGEDPDDDDDDDDGDDDGDDDDDEDEPETEPHRRWLEEFVDERMEDVPDSEKMRSLYAAYSKAYAILKADATCPADLLVEVAGLCEQLQVAAELETNAGAESETGEDPGTEDPSRETGPSNDSGEEEDESDESGDASTSNETLPEDSAGGSSEGGWNGPYIDDPEVGGSGSDDNESGSGGGSGSSSSGAAGSAGSPAASGSSSSADSGARVNPASGSGSAGGGSPAKMSQLYGRNLGAGANASGGSYAMAGNYIGSGGTSADGSVATNYVDDIPYDLLKWKYGGFKPPTNAVRSTVVVTDLRVDKNGFRFKWVRDIGAWGIPYEVPDALACFFVKNNAGEWVGGKFEWISSSRDKREFTNIRDGYNGWNLRDVPNPCEVAFLVFRKDGKRRSNIVAGVWQR